MFLGCASRLERGCWHCSCRYNQRDEDDGSKLAGRVLSGLVWHALGRGQQVGGATETGTTVGTLTGTMAGIKFPSGRDVGLITAGYFVGYAPGSASAIVSPS